MLHTLALLPNFDFYLCLRVKFHKSLFWVPILAAGGPYWVPISQKNGSLLGPYLKAWGSLIVLVSVNLVPDNFSSKIFKFPCVIRLKKTSYGIRRIKTFSLQVDYPEIAEGIFPRHRFMSAYEQKVACIHYHISLVTFPALFVCLFVAYLYPLSTNRPSGRASG